MQGNPTGHTQSTYDLLDVFPQGGCPVCTLTLRSVKKYIGSINYDSVEDPGVQTQLQAALGFCNLHAYEWLNSAFILGTAEIYRDVVWSISKDLRAKPSPGHGIIGRLASFASGLRQGQRSRSNGSFMAPSASCPVCAVLSASETMLVATMKRALPDRGFKDAYSASSGLCIPHLRIALEPPISPNVYEVLRSRALQTQDVLVSQLGEIIRKHDYRYREELSGEERGAAARAVSHVAGAQGVTKTLIL